MADLIAIVIPNSRVHEATQITATAYFRTRSTGAASTPTTIHYKVEDESTEQTIRDWTSVTAASSASITLSSTDNVIKDATNKYERRRLLVMADKDLSTQAVNSITYLVKNVRGIS